MQTRACFSLILFAHMRKKLYLCARIEDLSDLSDSSDLSEKNNSNVGNFFGK